MSHRIASTATISHRSRQLWRNAVGLSGLRREDVWLASFPRSGSTWCRFVIANVMSLLEDGREILTSTQIAERAPVLGWSNLREPWRHPSMPRVVKTHQPYRSVLFAIPDRSVLLVRDPINAIRSLHRRLQRSPLISVDADLAAFLRHRQYGMPAFARHYRSWRTRATLTLHYEEMVEDAARQFRRLFDALEVPVPAAIISRAVGLASLERVRAAEGPVRGEGEVAPEPGRPAPDPIAPSALSADDRAYCESICRDVGFDVQRT